ncbi:MAG: hypothetical protein UW87_C0048G0001, partial [Candidatus Moranbacteria bacterium GW2011_GWC2_45_10]
YLRVAIYDGSVLGINRNASLLFKGVIIHRGAFVADHSGLAHDRVRECGFSMIHVGDYGDIPDFHKFIFYELRILRNYETAFYNETDIHRIRTFVKFVLRSENKNRPEGEAIYKL